jgi:predicted Zn-dependent protease
VLFEGTAAAQILHELLAEALSGTPAPKGAEWSEGPLARKLGKLILPETFSVVDDPSLGRVGTHPLLGSYPVDDEGVPAQRVSLVERGRLRSWLMSRTPRKGFADSNGHGRSGLAGWAKGKVGNLIAQSRGGLPRAALVARLLRAVREDGASHGLIIRELEARPSATNGQAPPDPVLAYEVTLDGKERLVRGGKFGQMSIRVLRDILATGSDVETYDYVESTGGFAIPASVASPSLLFEDIEVKRRTEPNKSAPIVPRPPID